MYCIYCGKKINETVNFCPYCGKAVSGKKKTDITRNVTFHRSISRLSDSTVVINAAEAAAINNVTDIIIGKIQPEEALTDIAQQGAKAAINHYVTHQLSSDSSLRNAVINSVNGQESLEDSIADMVQQKAQIIVYEYVKTRTYRIMPKRLSNTSFEKTVTSNISELIFNDKKIENALNDIAEEGAKTAINSLLQVEDTAKVTAVLNDSMNIVHNILGAADVPGEVILSFVGSKEIILKWVNGEVPTNRFLLELGEKATMLSMSGCAALGQALIPIPVIGATIGNMIGSALTSGLNNKLLKGLQQKVYEQYERERIIKECEMIAQAERQYRKQLEEYLENYFREYRCYFNNALAQIDSAFLAGDADGVIQGTNLITRKLGGNVRYDTVEEFKMFLESDEIDVF